MNLINVYVEKHNRLNLFNSPFKEWKPFEYLRINNVAPINPIMGDIYYDYNSRCVRCWNGSAWLQVAEGNGVAWN